MSRATVIKQQLMEDLAEMLLKELIDMPEETANTFREFIDDMHGEVEAAIVRRTETIKKEHEVIEEMLEEFTDGIL